MESLEESLQFFESWQIFIKHQAHSKVKFPEIKNLEKQLDHARNSTRIITKEYKDYLKTDSSNLTTKYFKLKEVQNALLKEINEAKRKIKQLNFQINDEKGKVDENCERQCMLLEAAEKKKVQEIRDKIKKRDDEHKRKIEEMNNELEMAQATTALEQDEIETTLRRKLIDLGDNIRRQKTTNSNLEMEIERLTKRLTEIQSEETTPDTTLQENLNFFKLNTLEELFESSESQSAAPQKKLEEIPQSKENTGRASQHKLFQNQSKENYIFSNSQPLQTTQSNEALRSAEFGNCSATYTTSQNQQIKQNNVPMTERFSLNKPSLNDQTKLYNIDDNFYQWKNLSQNIQQNEGILSKTVNAHQTIDNLKNTFEGKQNAALNTAKDGTAKTRPNILAGTDSEKAFSKSRGHRANPKTPNLRNFNKFEKSRSQIKSSDSKVEKMNNELEIVQSTTALEQDELETTSRRKLIDLGDNIRRQKTTNKNLEMKLVAKRLREIPPEEKTLDMTLQDDDLKCLDMDALEELFELSESQSFAPQKTSEEIPQSNGIKGRTSQHKLPQNQSKENYIFSKSQPLQTTQSNEASRNAEFSDRSATYTTSQSQQIMQNNVPMSERFSLNKPSLNHQTKLYNIDDDNFDQGKNLSRNIQQKEGILSKNVNAQQTTDKLKNTFEGKGKAALNTTKYNTAQKRQNVIAGADSERAFSKSRGHRTNPKTPNLKNFNKSEKSRLQIKSSTPKGKNCENASKLGEYLNGNKNMVQVEKNQGATERKPPKKRKLFDSTNLDYLDDMPLGDS